MTNEISFFIRLVLDAAFVLLLFRLGKAGLYAAIVTNLLLISVMGGKFVSIFGMVTNTGNVFYASVFLATFLLVEHHGRKEALKSVLMGFAALVLFVIMGQLTINYAGVPETNAIHNAMQVLFQSLPRIAFASVLAYLFAQSFAIFIYSELKRRWPKGNLLLRNMIAAVVGQLLDSIIFFMVAFAGTIAGPVVAQAIAAGFILKILAALLTTPVLYASFLGAGKSLQSHAPKA